MALANRRLRSGGIGHKTFEFPRKGRSYFFVCEFKMSAIKVDVDGVWRNQVRPIGCEIVGIP